jgi:hypothetical protein
VAKTEKEKFFEELDRKRAEPAFEVGKKDIEFEHRQRDASGLPPPQGDEILMP